VPIQLTDHQSLSTPLAATVGPPRGQAVADSVILSRSGNRGTSKAVIVSSVPSPLPADPLLTEGEEKILFGVSMNDSHSASPLLPGSIHPNSPPTYVHPQLSSTVQSRQALGVSQVRLLDASATTPPPAKAAPPTQKAEPTPQKQSSESSQAPPKTLAYSPGLPAEPPVALRSFIGVWESGDSKFEINDDESVRWFEKHWIPCTDVKFERGGLLCHAKEGGQYIWLLPESRNLLLHLNTDPAAVFTARSEREYIRISPPFTGPVPIPDDTPPSFNP